VKLDEIDVKILHALIRDARTNLKEIAKECGVSSNAIFKRVKHLKDEGVIVGTVLYADLNEFGRMYPASIGINLNPNQEEEVAKLIRERASVIESAQSVGKYDLLVFMVAKSISEIDNIKQLVRKHPGVKNVAVNLWTNPRFTFENLNLQPQESE
jgi:DNA-binding Lrp family transcriptional regulator